MMNIDLLSVCCTSPKVFFNSQYKDLLLHCDCIFVDGRFIHVSQEQRFAALSGVPLSRLFGVRPPVVPSYDELSSRCEREHVEFYVLLQYVYDSISNFCNECYFLDTFSGEMFPLFIAVGCNHCGACKQRKLSDVIQRCKFQALQSQCLPLYVTLTYNNAHLPYHGVNKRHVQLFKKRFKILVCRVFGNEVGNAVKFYVTSEYVPSTHRPHYHMLVFGVPFDRSKDVYRVYHMLEFCWRESVRLPNGRYYSFDAYCRDYPLVFRRPDGYDPLSFGFINVRQCDNVSSALSYILKYQFKDDVNECEHWFEGVRMHATFHVSSVNMGVDFVMSHKSALLQSSDGVFSYYDWCVNKKSDCRLCAYFINKLFPPFTRLVSSEFRRALRDVIYFGNYMLRLGDFAQLRSSVLHTMQYIFDKFEAVVPDYGSFGLPPCSLRDPLFEKSFILNEFMKSSDYLINHDELNIKELEKCELERSLFLGKLNFESRDVMKVVNDYNKSKLINQSKQKL